MTTTDNPTLLLLDDRVARVVKNARLELGVVEKDAHNPLFREGIAAQPPRPWEARMDNMYPTVIYDDETLQYKLWYCVYIIDELSNQTPLEQRSSIPYHGGVNEDGLLYGVSDDGIYWTLPDLGLIEFQGSTHNNLLMRSSTHGIHAGGVIKDNHDPDPSKRYKIFFRNRTQRCMSVAFSPDGLYWSDPVPWPKYNAVGDSHNHAMWVPEMGKYVGITRGWTVEPYNGIRLVLRTDSDDFVNWSEPVEVFRGRNEHDQIYSMPVIQTRNLFIGLPAIFHKGDPHAPDWDTVTTELAWSPDTVAWNRICAGSALIPMGSGRYPDGEHDCGCIYAAAPVIKENDILIYYCGSNGLHNGWREGSFNLALLKRDRFAGYVPDNPLAPGLLLSNVLVVQSESLTLNCEVFTDGCVRVGILDENGETIPGFGLNECRPIISGALDAQVEWNVPQFCDLLGRKISIEIELLAAKLYALTGCARREDHEKP